MDLFQFGEVKLASGRISRFKIECDAWTDGDVRCLAAMIAEMVGPFGSVEGVPRGGLRLADELRRHHITSPMAFTHEFDSSRTCNYCGIAAEKVPGIAERSPCPNYRSSQPLHLIVDDVFTSGRSMRRAYHERANSDSWKDNPFGIIAAVVFARGRCPSWVQPLFQLHESLWEV